MDNLLATSRQLAHALLQKTRLSPRALALCGGAVVALVVLVLGAWAWVTSQERAASEAYSVAFIRAQAAQTASASPTDVTAAIAELESVLARYPSAAQSAQAAYQIANFQYQARQWERARNAYQLAVSKGLPGPLRTLAYDSIGHTWESERNWAKAVDTYHSLLASLQEKDFLHETVLLDLARAQDLAGRKDEAIESYRRALKGFAGGPRGDEIRTRLASLGATP